MTALGYSLLGLCLLMIALLAWMAITPFELTR